MQLHAKSNEFARQSLKGVLAIDRRWCSDAI